MYIAIAFTTDCNFVMLLGDSDTRKRIDNRQNESWVPGTERACHSARINRNYRHTKVIRVANDGTRGR